MNGNKLKTLSFLLSIVVLSFIVLTSGISPPTPENFKTEKVPDALQYFETRAIERGWTITEVVFNESDTGFTPKIATDHTGNVHLVWYDHADYEGAGTEPDIFYRVWNATTGAWMPVEVVSFEHNGTSYIPVIAVDADGHVHVAWADNTNYSSAGTDDDIFYERWNATTGTWTPTAVVSNVSSGNSVDPQIATDAHGNVHAVWKDMTDYNDSGSDWDLFYGCWNTTTDTWTMPQVVTAESTSGSQQPALAADSNGTVHVVWKESFGGYNNIFYKYRNATDATWSAAELITTESSTFDTRLAEIAVDKGGHLHMVYWQVGTYGGSGSDDDIFYKRRNATTGNWTITEVVSTESVSHSSEPALTTDHEGNVHVAWSDFITIVYKYWNATTGNWTSTEVVSTESTGISSKPTIAVDGTGIVHIAWEDTTNYLGAGTDYDIFYKKTVWLLNGPVLEPILPNPDLDGTIELNWSAVANVTLYYIYRDLSPFTAIGGRSTIGSTSLTNYTDPGLLSGTYYYAVMAGNATHNSSLSNCESVIVQLPDTQPPQYSNAVEGRSSPQNYTATQRYQFNLTITDDVGLGTVFLEWNGTNFTVSTQEGDEYYYEFVDLGAGSYQYRWFFNDTSNIWNATFLKPYIITKAAPNLDLLLNGTPANYQTNGTWYCNLTITVPLGDTVYLYVNESLLDSGPAPLVTVSQFNQLGVYNVTAWYPGGANYSAMARTRWLTVGDGIPPDPCNLNITYPYPPNFVLENTLFELWGGPDVGGGISS